MATAVSACGGGSGGGSGQPPSAQDNTSEEVIRTSIAADDWPSAAPASQGVSADNMEKLLDEQGTMAAMRGLVVVRDDILIGERYYGDARSSDLRHTRSATKSFSGLLTAQAIEAG